jgi:PAS domain S-box-containing protein
MFKGSKKNHFLRYALAPVFVTLAVLVGELIHSVSPGSVQYAFLAAVVAAAWIGGRGPGLITAGLAPLVLDYYFLPPLYTWGISEEARPYVVPFLLAGLGAAWLSSARAEASEAKAAQLLNYEKFRRLLTNLPDVTWSSDQNGRIIYMSPKVEKLLGYTEQEIYAGGAEFLFSRTHPDDVARVQAAAAEMFARQTAFDIEFRYQRKDGAWIWIHNRAIGAYEMDGLIRADGVFSDVSPRKGAEIELREKTAFLEAQINANIDGILVIDANGRRLQQNQRIIEMFDIPDELASNSDQLPAREYMLGKMKEPEVVRALIKRAYENSESSERLEFDLLDGTNIELYSSPVRGQGGEYYGRIWTFRDITERKQYEAVLKAKTAFLEAQVNASIDGILVVNESGKRILINQRLIELFGVPPEIVNDTDDEHLLRHVLRLVADPESFLARVKYLNDHPVETSRDEIEFKDGRTFDRYSAAVIDKDWNYFGRIWSFREITERKQNECSLRQLSTVVEQSPIVVVITDPAGTINYVNPKFTEVTGYSFEEVLGKNPRILNSGHSPKAVYKELWKTILSGKTWQGEFRNKKKNGELYWDCSTITPIFDAAGAITSFLSMKEDVTERKAMESELRQAQKLEGIGQLAAGIAHEINTPTQFVTDNLTFLMESWVSAKPVLDRYRRTMSKMLPSLAPETLAEIVKAEQACDLNFISVEVPRAIEQSLDGARRVAKIVRAMKEFSHPDSAEKSDTDLNKGILSTITVARNEWKYVAEMETDLDESLPQVFCYPGEVNQVILNLVVNAAHSIKDKVKDGEKGKIKVSTRNRGAMVEIAIADNGMGIPESIQNRIYEPFFTTKEVGKGTGQGLSFAHSVVVKKHQGKIRFETEAGRGATFFVELPIREPAAVKESDA